ncbi:MAG: thioredoxin family protein [Saprospiraceae bacterium]
MKKYFGALIAIFIFLLMSFSIIEDGHKVGDIATDFNLMGTTDEKVSLSDYPDAEGYIIVFTCNSCPYSVMYEDRIISLHHKWAHKGFPVIAINPNDPEIKSGDSFEKMKERANDKNFPFPYLFDEGQSVFPKYGATRTPHAFVLDKERVVRYIGAIDNNARNAASASINYIDNAVKAIKLGNSPDPSFTKAIGCGIKHNG